MAGGLVLEAIYNGNVELHGVVNYVAKSRKTEVGKIAAQVEQVLAALVDSGMVRRVHRKNGKINYFITKLGRDSFKK